MGDKNYYKKDIFRTKWEKVAQEMYTNSKHNISLICDAIWEIIDKVGKINFEIFITSHWRGKEKHFKKSSQKLNSTVSWSILKFES